MVVFIVFWDEIEIIIYVGKRKCFFFFWLCGCFYKFLFEIGIKRKINVVVYIVSFFLIVYKYLIEIMWFLI